MFISIKWILWLDQVSFILLTSLAQCLVNRHNVWMYNCFYQALLGTPLSPLFLLLFWGIIYIKYTTLGSRLIFTYVYIFVATIQIEICNTFSPQKHPCPLPLSVFPNRRWPLILTDFITIFDWFWTILKNINMYSCIWFLFLKITSLRWIHCFVNNRDFKKIAL